MTSLIIDPRGDDADTRANVISVFCDDERRPLFEGASVWRGRLHRTGDDWQVSAFSLSLVWSRGTFPVALEGQPASDQ
jgi:hypothetical protein